MRRISYGEGVERVFPLHSPRVDKIEVDGHGQVRRAKLTYLRKRLGKGATLVNEKQEKAVAAPARYFTNKLSQSGAKASPFFILMKLLAVLVGFGSRKLNRAVKA